MAAASTRHTSAQPSQIAAQCPQYWNANGEFLDNAASITQMITYGDPFAETTTSGPIINQRQLGRVMGYIEKGQEEGAKLVTGARPNASRRGRWTWPRG